MRDVKRSIERTPTIDPEELRPRGEWVSVDDRLPEQNKSVLVYFDSGNMAVGYWYDKDEWLTFWQAWTDDGWLADCDCIPLYWMPLPEPPDMRGDKHG